MKNSQLENERLRMKNSQLENERLREIAATTHGLEPGWPPDAEKKSMAIELLELRTEIERLNEEIEAHLHTAAVVESALREQIEQLQKTLCDYQLAEIGAKFIEGMEEEL